MTRNMLIALAAGGSAALLIAALGFQYLGGLPPCKLCYWQRYPHVAAIVLGLIAIGIKSRAVALVGAIAALTTAGLGLYHTGVERGWWEGPTTCTSSSIDGLSTDALMDQIMNAPVTRCDEIAWEFLTLSMASWNMIASLVLAGLWIAAYRRS
ncbi:Disulfide bond formation protein DsbB [Roseivivax halotolerans]|uniref:Disulfide bond formation protein DsbB n=2 Tax=Roseobacteraceae TaxID=2854170 RepID=A0A1I5Z7R8_9RHOB|nr:disulfide bond formation protein B [Roseivivax sp. THAF30]SFQ52405.1 Disulfide bond formation protein DsbB [Roseivivax halotolerans]